MCPCVSAAITASVTPLRPKESLEKQMTSSSESRANFSLLPDFLTLWTLIDTSTSAPHLEPFFVVFFFFLRAAVI